MTQNTPHFDLEPIRYRAANDVGYESGDINDLEEGYRQADEDRIELLDYIDAGAPRPITVWDDLHFLPTGTVLRDADGHIVAKVADPWGLTDEIVWRIAGSDGEGDPCLPATVLHIPMNGAPGGEPHGR